MTKNELEDFLHDYLWYNSPIAGDILCDHFNGDSVKTRTTLEKAYDEFFWALCKKFDVNTTSAVHNASD